MLFTADITIPKNTTQVSPTTIDLPIAHGIITKFMVRPRAGHAALAHLVIYHASHQIAPSTEGMDIHGDSDPVDWDDYYEFYQPPYQIRLVGWNDDDTYPHTFTVFVAVLPRKAIIAYQIVNALKKALGAISPARIPIPAWLKSKEET